MERTVSSPVELPPCAVLCRSRSRHGNGGGMNISDMTHLGMQIELVDPSALHAFDNTREPSASRPALPERTGRHDLLGHRGRRLGKIRRPGVRHHIELERTPTCHAICRTPPTPANFTTTRATWRCGSFALQRVAGVRLTYDYVRSDTPVAVQGLVDRPDDGGGVLTASWSLVHDEDFARYLIFLNEGPWTTPPTELDLLGQTPDKAVSLHSRLSADIETANGAPLVDGTDYYAVAVVEYTDGRWGQVSPPFGPASPSDEIPGAPQWATANALGSSGDDGDVQLEWARCTP